MAQISGVGGKLILGDKEYGLAGEWVLNTKPEHDEPVSIPVLAGLALTLKCKPAMLLLPCEIMIETPVGRHIGLAGCCNVSATRAYLRWPFDDEAYLLENLAPDGKSMTLERVVYDYKEARQWVMGLEDEE